MFFACFALQIKWISEEILHIFHSIFIFFIQWTPENPGRGRRHNSNTSVYWCWYKANSNLWIILLRLRSLFTLHNWCVSHSLVYLKSLIESKSRLPIPQFYGSYCMYSSSILCCGICVFLRPVILSTTICFKFKKGDCLEPQEWCYFRETG